MATANVSKINSTSGSFLLGDRCLDECFVIEDVSEESRNIARTAKEFVQQNIESKINQIERQDFSLIRDLIVQASAAGISNVDVPREYGGQGMGHVAACMVTERLSVSGSVSLSFAAHSVNGILPILYFGTNEQRQRYLPKLARGQWIATFALTESVCGSDVFGITTDAGLSGDGREWVINGEKTWVTNGGFADIYIVFAKVDNEKLSAFIVERSFSGLSIGPEYEKVGAQGSSTCSLRINGCRVPRENLLGEIGKGHLVAFTTLDVARLRLSAASLGATRESLNAAVAHVCGRKAFDRALAEFGSVKQKIAEMAAGIYCGESMLYRTAGRLDAMLLDPYQSTNESEQITKAIEECASECSILKVWASELLAYTSDEALQILGASAFGDEHPVGRAYRDARLHRICQGTNEINRLIIAVWVLKRATSGKLRLGDFIRVLTDEIMSGPKTSQPLQGPMAAERELAERIRRATLMVLGTAWQKFGIDLVDQQELIMAIADMLIETYAVDSVIRRTRILVERNGEATVALAMTQLVLARSLDKSEVVTRRAMAAIAEDEMLERYLVLMQHFFSYRPFNVIALCQQIANHVIGNWQVPDSVDKPAETPPCQFAAKAACQP